jgi:hypothetical protein
LCSVLSYQLRTVWVRSLQGCVDGGGARSVSRRSPHRTSSHWLLKPWFVPHEPEFGQLTQLRVDRCVSNLQRKGLTHFVCRQRALSIGQGAEECSAHSDDARSSRAATSADRPEIWRDSPGRACVRNLSWVISSVISGVLQPPVCTWRPIRPWHVGDTPEPFECTQLRIGAWVPAPASAGAPMPIGPAVRTAPAQRTAAAALTAIIGQLNQDLGCGQRVICGSQDRHQSLTERRCALCKPISSDCHNLPFVSSLWSGYDYRTTKWPPWVGLGSSLRR